MRELPHITVATVVEDDGRFLLVRERSDGAIVYNQPAGHLECGESLVDAAIRETLEESAWEVEISAFLGVYHYKSPHNGVTFVRHCFIGSPRRLLEDRPLDTDILDANWYTPQQIKSLAGDLRSPLVLQAVEDYLAGKRYELNLVTHWY
jgi:ADP-ribose pyrophosphatase YjhB (NUDIX family)